MQSAAVISTASLPVALLNGVGGSVFAHFHRLRFLYKENHSLGEWFKKA